MEGSLCFSQRHIEAGDIDPAGLNVSGAHMPCLFGPGPDSNVNMPPEYHTHPSVRGMLGDRLVKPVLNQRYHNTRFSGGTLNDAFV